MTDLDTALLPAIALGVTVDSAFQSALAFLFGSGEYRKVVVPRLLLLTASGALGFWQIGQFNLPG